MNGIGLFILLIGALVICFIPLRPNTDARRRRTRGPINITLHRTDRK
jgi:hypothetical protein